MKTDLQNEQDESRKTGGHILEHIVLENENEKKKDLEVMLTRLGLGKNLVLEVCSLLGDLLSDCSFIKGNVNFVTLDFLDKNISPATLMFVAKDPKMEKIYYYPNADETYTLYFNLHINGEHYAEYSGTSRYFRLTTSNSDGLFIAFGDLRENQVKVYYYNEKSKNRIIDECHMFRESLQCEEDFVKNVMQHFNSSDRYIRPQSITTIEFDETEDIIPYLMEGKWLHMSNKKTQNFL